MGYAVSLEKFQTVFDSWRKKYDIYAPKVFEGTGRFSETDVVRYGKVTDLADIDWNERSEYSFKDIRINVDDHKVLVNNTELTLTTTEYNLLQLLIKHPKQTFTKESLYQLIWGKDYISDDNTLNVHISKLRKKLEHIGNQAPYIDTVWGIGYKLHR